MYMHIKIFTKNEKEQEILIETMKIYWKDIGTEFDIEKYAILIIKKEKKETTEEIELPSQESIETLGEKENYKI